MEVILHQDMSPQVLLSPTCAIPQMPNRPQSCPLGGLRALKFGTAGALAAQTKIPPAASRQLAGWKSGVVSLGCPPSCQPQLHAAGRVEFLVHVLRATQDPASCVFAAGGVITL